MAGRYVGALGADGALDWLLGVVSANPVLAAGVALGLFVLLVGAYVALRWYRRPAAARLARVAAGAEEISILVHPNPDPDAMGAALGVKHLVETTDADATIQYPGEIRHHENRSFRTVLDLDLDHVERAEDVTGDAVVLVDHNEPRGFQGAEGLTVDAVVDHHPGTGTGRSFTDVRPEYGAASTIVAEYLETLDLEPASDGTVDENADLPPAVASGLLYGILADTDHLTKGATPAEFDASAYLSTGIDEDLLDRIANPQVDAETLEVKARAIADRVVDPPFAVSHVGDISNVDAIPQAADELLHLEGVTAVVVTGTSDGTVHLSGRSRDDRVHMGRVLQSVLDDIPMASGGGHARMGGGQCSIDHMAGLGPSDGVSMDDLHERLFAVMSGEEHG
jgi:nanoRNase/pAp phosphatase (c-di-AMP/oligoRNAs hydrolase)